MSRNRNSEILEELKELGLEYIAEEWEKALKEETPLRLVKEDNVEIENTNKY